MHPDEPSHLIRDDADIDAGTAPMALPDELVPTPADAAETLLPDADAAVEAEPVGAVVEAPLELPDDPAEARDVLLEAFSETRRAAAGYAEALQRVAADYDNYRKRVERDRAEMIERASQRILEQLLPALDNFDAALAYEPQTPAEEKILDGMRGTHSQLMEILEREGLEPVDALGHGFDPAVHEAVAGPTGGGDDLVVDQELRKGYSMRGRLIRPSLVTVEATEEGGENTDDTERS